MLPGTPNFRDAKLDFAPSPPPAAGEAHDGRAGPGGRPGGNREVGPPLLARPLAVAEVVAHGHAPLGRRVSGWGAPVRPHEVTEYYQAADPGAHRYLDP